MTTILYRQPLRLWHTLRMRHRLEALFLALVLFTVPATRAHAVFGHWLETGMSLNRLIFFLLWSFLALWLLIQFPVFHFLTGRQRLVALAAPTPASPRQARQILFYVSLKYQLALIFIFTPLWAALWGHSPGGTLSLGLLMPAGAALVWRSALYLYLRWSPKPWWVLWLLTLGLMAGGFYAYFWHLEIYYLALFLLFTALYAFGHRSTEIDLQSFPGRTHHSPDNSRRYLPSEGKKKSPVPSSPLQAWIIKERLARRRLRPFRRWRWAMFLWAAVTLFALSFSSLAEKNLIIFGLAVLYLWVYLGAGFNEKYREPESPWLIQSAPLRLRDWWLARLWVEGGDALWGLALVTAAWQVGGLEGELLPIYALTLIVLWFIFFSAMVNFQIMFYDNVRMAGYAFHFTMLLLGIMIVNYRLVGPLIALALMLFFSYKNYKYINR